MLNRHVNKTPYIPSCVGMQGVTGFKLKEAIPSLLKILRSKYIYPFGIQPDVRRRVNPDAPRMIPEFHLSDILDILYTNFGIDIREDRSTIKEFVKMLLPSLFLGSEIIVDWWFAGIVISLSIMRSFILLV